MSKCVSITKINKLDMTDVLKVRLEIDGVPSDAIWFYDEADALKYVGEDVIVETRKEIYQGNMVDVINTFTVPTQINTIDKQSGFKLYSNAEDNFATISFNDIAENDELPNAILYCIASEVMASQKATWLSLTVRDKMFHVATLRLFAYDRSFDYAGHYIYCTPLKKTQYGLQTEEIKAVDGETPENPEITLAKQYIKQVFADRPYVLETLEKFDLFNVLEHIVDFELGYKIVRIATSLALTETLPNILNTIDIQSIQEAFIADALAFINPDSILSHTVKSCVYASKCKWTDKKKVIRIIDISTEDVPIERQVYDYIKGLANTLIIAKKGGANEGL